MVVELSEGHGMMQQALVAVRRAGGAGDLDLGAEARGHAVEKDEILRVVPHAPGREDRGGGRVPSLNDCGCGPTVVDDVYVAPEGVTGAQVRREGVRRRHDSSGALEAARCRPRMPFKVGRQRTTSHARPPGRDAGMRDRDDGKSAWVRDESRGVDLDEIRAGLFRCFENALAYRLEFRVAPRGPVERPLDVDELEPVRRTGCTGPRARRRADDGEDHIDAFARESHRHVA